MKRDLIAKLIPAGDNIHIQRVDGCSEERTAEWLKTDEACALFTGRERSALASGHVVVVREMRWPLPESLSDALGAVLGTIDEAADAMEREGIDYSLLDRVAQMLMVRMSSATPEEAVATYLRNAFEEQLQTAIEVFAPGGVSRDTITKAVQELVDGVLPQKEDSDGKLNDFTEQHGDPGRGSRGADVPAPAPDRESAARVRREHDPAARQDHAHDGLADGADAAG